MYSAKARCLYPVSFSSSNVNLIISRSSSTHFYLTTPLKYYTFGYLQECQYTQPPYPQQACNNILLVVKSHGSSEHQYNSLSTNTLTLPLEIIERVGIHSLHVLRKRQLLVPSLLLVVKVANDAKANGPSLELRGESILEANLGT